VKSVQGLTLAALMGAAVAGGLMWVLDGRGGDPGASEPLESERGAVITPPTPGFGAATLAKASAQGGGAVARSTHKSGGAAGADPSLGGPSLGGPSLGSAPKALPRRPLFAGQDRFAGPDRGPGALQPEAAQEQAFQEILDRADRHFAQGDSKLGAGLLRGVFTRASHRSDVNLAPQVVRLLEIDDDALWRGKYIDYLVRRGAGVQALESQLQRARALAASEKSEDLQGAWMEFSGAHRLATNGAARERVFTELTPILERHVFSGRFSPLVEAYNVKPGENLTRIAKRYRTTPDAILRLSNLSSDVIQPGMRLRLVPGDVAVVVDKSDFLLWVTVDGKLLLQRRVGLGKDNRTPTGSFVVRVRQKDPTWYPPGQTPIAAGDPRNVLGARWLGFENTEKVQGIGIHGTRDPSSIGREVSNGCIRLLDEDVVMLYDFVPHGTRVVVRE